MEKQSIKINRKVLSKEKEVNLNLEFIVPDAKPDIVAVLDTNANTYIYNEELGVGKIRLDGNIDTKVLYLADSGDTRSLSVTLDFSEVLDDEQITADLRFYSSVELLKIESRIVNERKISVSAKIKMYVAFYEAKEIELIASLDDFENLEIKEEKCKIKNLIGANKAKASIKEVVECDTMDNILDLLSVDFRIGTIDNKVSYNKVLSKADCEIKIVYQTEDMTVKTKTVSYPIMSFIDLENVSEDHTLDTKITLRNMQVFLAQNESNKINVNFEFETALQVYEIREISIIEDVYSLNKELEFTKKEFEAEFASEEIRNTFSISEEVVLEDVSKIIQTSSSMRVVSMENVGNYINYNIEVYMKLMYELDSRRGLAVKNATFNSMIKLDVNESSEVIFNISNENISMHGDRVSCNLEITSIVRKNSFQKISVLEDIKEEGEMAKPEYSMVVYFVKPKDTVWKIAKNFKVSMQSIIDSNNLENPDKINIGDRLYIVR